MSMNPSCDDCGEEDAEHVLCDRCSNLSGEADAAEERKAIVAWLTTKTVAYGDQPNLDHIIDAIERGEHLPTPKRGEGT